MAYLGATFGASILTARILGTDQFGMYAVALAFTGTVNVFLNFGQGSSLLVFFAEEYAKQGKQGMAIVLRNYLHLSLLNVLILVILILLTPWFARTLYGRSDIALPAQLLFAFDAVDIWSSMGLTILQATRSIRPKVAVEQASNMAVLGCGLFGLLFGFGVTGIVTGQLIAALVMLPVTFIIVRRSVRHSRLPSMKDLWRIRFGQTVPYIGQSVLFAVDKNIGGLFPNALFFLVSLIAPPAAVGVMRIATQIAAMPRTVVLPHVADLSVSVFAKLRASGGDGLRRNAAQVVKHALLLHSLMVLGALIASPFVLLLYGPQYADAIPLTLVLLPLSLPVSLTITNSPLLRMFRKIHLSIVLTSASWLIAIGGMLLLRSVIAPYTLFALMYGFLYAMPCVLTIYIFRRLLQPLPATT